MAVVVRRQPVRHLGYEVVPHPTIDGSERKPDFLVTSEASVFYVECTATAAGGTRGTVEWIYDCISDVQTRDFLIGIDEVQRGTQHPKRSEVTRPIERWLDELDPDAPEKRLPRKIVLIRDWSLTCFATPNCVKPSIRFRGVSSNRPCRGGFREMVECIHISPAGRSNCTAVKFLDAIRADLLGCFTTG